MKVLYDEGTREEKWWIGVAVEKLSEESHCIYFPEDQEVAAVSSARCLMRKPVQLLERKCKYVFQMKLFTISCGKVLLLVPSKTTVIECFFVADHEISDIKHQLIQFCRSNYPITTDTT